MNDAKLNRCQDSILYLIYYIRLYAGYSPPVTNTEEFS